MTAPSELSYLKDCQAMAQVAVIIPCYNNEAFIKQAIKSVLDQKGPAIEVLVIDDGSTDGSVETAESCGDRVQVICQPNQGACVARNRGLAESTAPNVKFLDADDYLAADVLQKQFEAIETLPKDSLVFGDAEWVDVDGNHLMDYYLNRDGKSAALAIAEVIEMTPLTSCPLHRREHLEEIGGFDPRCLRSQEFDLHVRLALAGFRFVHVPGCVYHYRQHQVGARISSNDREFRVQKSKFEMLERLAALARCQDDNQNKSEIDVALGKTFWRVGRLASRSANRTLAEACFDKAKSLGGDRVIVGSKIYRLLSRVLSPLWLG